MRAPAFWDGPPERPGALARLLTPLSWVLTRVTARRVSQAAEVRPGVPVICVGNINLGGTGKTPTAIAVVEAIEGAHIVSRGYGGAEEGPLRVDPARHRAADVGDEPLLLSAFAPVWVAKHRGAGAREAEAAGAKAIVLDDGFQNPTVAKDTSLVVVDAGAGFGNGRVFPAGPLREPVKAGLARADAVVLIGAEAERAVFLKRWGDILSETPVLTAVLEPVATGRDWPSVRAVAFAGIGRPEKFFSTLEGLGATILARHALDDHQPIARPLLERLLAEAREAKAQLVTTEKDLMRLPLSARREVLTVMVRLAFDDPAAFRELISRPVRRR